MKERFMFGKIRTVQDDKEIEAIMQLHTRYEIMFNEYINNVYDNNDSKIITWNLYVGNVLTFEKAFNKYVFEFNVTEMKELLKSVPSNSLNIVSQVFGMVNQYINYAIAVKKFITINVLESIDREEIRKVSAKALQKKVIGLSQFWRMIKQMDSKIGNKSDLLPLVFGRYGIVGTDNIHILEASINNIDRENLVYSTMDKDEILVVPIDQKFIRFCDSVVEENELNSGKANLIVEDITEGVLYGRLAKAFKLIGISNMKIRDLQKSRLLDILFMTRMERKLITADFRDVLKMYYPNSSAGRYMSYVKWYENLTDEKVESIKYVKSEKDLEDPNGVNAVLELKDRLNFN